MTDLDRKAVITDGSADVAVGRQRRVENHMALNAEISLFSRILTSGVRARSDDDGPGDLDRAVTGESVERLADRHLSLTIEIGRAHV